YSGLVAEWSFLTKHAAVLLCIAQDPGARLRDIAAAVDITERTAHGIVVVLAESGYVVKTREGPRNRYQVQPDLPLHTPDGRQPPVGEVLAPLPGPDHEQSQDIADRALAPQRGVQGKVRLDLVAVAEPAWRRTRPS